MRKIKDSDIAQIVGTTRQAVTNWRQKKRTPPIDTIIKIEDHFKLPYRALLRENENLEAMEKILADLKEQEKNIKKIIKEMKEYIE
jgi:transcriptional regulator with XRE-family HTH domain